VQSAHQIIRQAKGKNFNEYDLLKQSIEAGLAGRVYDSKTKATTFQSGPWDGKDALQSGGTNPRTIAGILKMNGVGASVENTTEESLRRAILDKKGIIASVDVSELWNRLGLNQSGGHAVTITDGDFDKDGKLTSVLINDTGVGQQLRIPISDFMKASDRNLNVWAGKLIVTNDPIWP
jgi:hypothetical protein